MYIPTRKKMSFGKISAKMNRNVPKIAAFKCSSATDDTALGKVMRYIWWRASWTRSTWMLVLRSYSDAKRRRSGTSQDECRFWRLEKKSTFGNVSGCVVRSSKLMGTIGNYWAGFLFLSRRHLVHCIVRRLDEFTGILRSHKDKKVIEYVTGKMHSRILFLLPWIFH